MGASPDTFLDTNVLLYLLSADPWKADRAEAAVAQGAVVSVQVLNEFAAVATRKLAMRLAEAREVLAAVRASCRVTPLTEEAHDLGLDIAERHRMPVYDAMVVASARLAGCGMLLSEDMQDGMRFDGGLRVRNPFRR